MIYSLLQTHLLSVDGIITMLKSNVRKEMAYLAYIHIKEIHIREIKSETTQRP